MLSYAERGWKIAYYSQVLESMIIPVRYILGHPHRVFSHLQCIGRARTASNA